MPIQKVNLPPKAPGQEYAAHLQSQPVQAFIETEKAKKKVPYASSSKTEQVTNGVLIPLDRLFMLNLEASRTFNLGDFESSKIHVGITVPCTKETLPDAFQWAETWVGGKIQDYEKLVTEGKTDAS